MRETVKYYPQRMSKKILPFGYYFKSGIFAQYVTKRDYNHYSDSNWKIHINYPIYIDREVREEYLISILGYLIEQDITHKIVIKEKDIIYRMNDPREDNTQNGKIITVYCNSEQECYRTIIELDEIIRNKGYILIPMKEEQTFRNDRLFNHNPYLGYRFASTPRRSYYVIPYDENGKEIDLVK